MAHRCADSPAMGRCFSSVCPHLRFWTPCGATHGLGVRGGLPRAASPQYQATRVIRVTSGETVPQVERRSRCPRYLRHLAWGSARIPVLEARWIFTARRGEGERHIVPGIHDHRVALRRAASSRLVAAIMVRFTEDDIGVQITLGAFLLPIVA